WGHHRQSSGGRNGGDPQIIDAAYPRRRPQSRVVDYSRPTDPTELASMRGRPNSTRGRFVTIGFGRPALTGRPMVYPQGGARVTTHSNGFDVIGAIEVKWLAKGGENGFLGKPLENEHKVDNGADEKGRMQRFT